MNKVRINRTKLLIMLSYIGYRQVQTRRTRDATGPRQGAARGDIRQVAAGVSGSDESAGSRNLEIRRTDAGGQMTKREHIIILLVMLAEYVILAAVFLSPFIASDSGVEWLARASEGAKLALGIALSMPAYLIVTSIGDRVRKRFMA